MIPLLVFALGALFAVLLWLTCFRALWNPFRSMRRRLLSVFLLEHIAAVVRLRLPLVSGIGACASRLSHASEDDLSNIEADLKAGLLLGDALGRAHLLSRGPVAKALDLSPNASDCLIRPSEAEVLRIAEATGNLEHGVNIILSERKRAGELRTWLVGTFFYVAALLVVIGGLLAGVMTFIVPKFKAMFDELDVTMPKLTQWLMVTMDHNGVYLLFPLVIALIALPFFYWPSSWSRAMIRAEQTFGDLIQRIVYSIPVIRGPLRRAQLGEFCRELAMLLRVGAPAHRALEVIASGTLNPEFRDRIAKAAELCKEGVPLGEALDDVQLDKKTGWFVAMDASADSIAAGMDALGDTYGRGVVRPATIVLRALPPLAVVCIGAVVGYIVIALFLPLLQLMSSL